MSFLGPRPQRSPLETSSHSITPLAPSVMVTWPSDAWAAEGMKIPATRRRAACTSGRRTIWGKWGDPISSSPSATSTKLSGGFLPARHGFVVALFDLREDRGEVVGAPRRGGGAGPGEGGGGGGGALEEGAAVHAHERPPGLGVRAGARFNLAFPAPSCGGAEWTAAYGDFRAAHRCELRGTARGGFVVQRTSLFALALAALGAVGASGQERQITGRVTSATNGEAIVGVNVSVTGTAFAAITNVDGRYAIAAPSGAVTLVFRRIAFKRREVQVAAGQNAADAALEADVFNLEAVVVTGQATGVERRHG